MTNCCSPYALMRINGKGTDCSIQWHRVAYRDRFRPPCGRLLSPVLGRYSSGESWIATPRLQLTEMEPQGLDEISRSTFQGRVHSLM